MDAFSGLFKGVSFQEEVRGVLSILSVKTKFSCFHDRLL